MTGKLALAPKPIPPVSPGLPVSVPFDESLERALLGALLVDGRRIIDARALLPDAKALFILSNELVYAAMLRLHDEGTAVDLNTVAAALRAAGHAQFADGDVFLHLSWLIAECPRVEHVESYAQTLADAYYRRRMLAALDRLRAHCAIPGRDSLDAAVQSELLSLADSQDDDDVEDMLTAVGHYMDGVEATLGAPEGVAGLSTGFPDLDDLLDGLLPETLTILAGRPGSGKSALAQTIALSVARRALAEGKGGVYFWSGEMGRKQVIERMMSIETELPGNRLRRGLRPGGLTQAEWLHFVEKSGDLSRLPLLLDDRDEITPTQLARRVMKTARRRGLSLIVVDYIGLMGAGVKRENREKELSFISRKLKALSKIAPVLCLAQLSRAVESRKDKRPVSRDLRDSGSLEQDADAVLMLYRDVMYNPSTLFPAQTELIATKNRNGSTGTVRLHFDHTCTRFRPIPRQTVSGQ